MIKKIKIPSAKSEDQPATRKMLSLVRDEILHKMEAGFGSVKAELRSEFLSECRSIRGEIAAESVSIKAELRAEIRAECGSIRAEMGVMKADIGSLKTDVSALKVDMAIVKSDLQGLRSDFQGMRSDFADLKAGNTRLHFLIEEQNANNRIVLEGLQAVWQRQDRIEAHTR